MWLPLGRVIIAGRVSEKLLRRMLLCCAAPQKEVSEDKVIFPDFDKRFNLLPMPENPGELFLNHLSLKKGDRYPKFKKQCIIVNSHNIYTTIYVETSSKFSDLAVF